MLISTMRFAHSLYRRRDQFKIVLLANETAIPFITGDQPIINVHATGSEVPERPELFYHLSPKEPWRCLSWRRNDQQH